MRTYSNGLYLLEQEQVVVSIDISFAILTWNSESFLEQCLASIHKVLEGAGLSYEILVLDNGSRDGTPGLLERLAAERPGLIIPHYELENIGTTRSRNRLFAAAQGTFLCVMDSDVVLEGGLFGPLLSVMNSDIHNGIVVPRIRFPNGAWQKSFDHFPTLIDKINRYFHLRAIEKRDSLRLRAATQPFCVDYAISAFWLLRRGLLDTVGLLDEKIFYSPEDVDFCLRVWKAGYKILYVPTVSIVHHTQEISRGWKINRAQLSHIKGLIYYFIKHHYLLRRPEISRLFKGAIPGFE